MCAECLEYTNGCKPRRNIQFSISLPFPNKGMKSNTLIQFKERSDKDEKQKKIIRNETYEYEVKKQKLISYKIQAAIYV